MKNKLVCTPGAEDKDEENENITNDVCGYAKQRCPICLNFLAQDVGIPENCYHAFCVACILKWSETSTSCPVDRKLFKAVYKINQSGAFTKIQVKSRRLKETHDSCYSSCNHSCSLCFPCNKICIRTEADRQNQSLECDKVQKGCIINKDKNESEPEMNSLSFTSSCFTDIAASCKPSSLIPVIPYCTDINAEVSENKEMDLIIQKREEIKYLQSHSVMPGIQSSTCFSMDTGTLTRPVVSSRLNEFIFHLNYFSVHNKGSSKRMCVLSAVQEGTEKKQTTSGSSNRRGTKKKPVYSSTRRRSARNSKSEDMGESQGSPKSSNSDRDTSGCNSSSTNVSSSENWVKQTPKQRKRPTKKGSQVRRRLRSSAQTEEVSSESEANSANETEQESEEKQLSEEIQSEMDIVNSDTEATCASKVECGQSPSSPSIENMSKEQHASLSSLKQSDVGLPHYPSLQSERNCGFGKPASPVSKNEEMFKQDLLPASPASEIHLESETAQLQDLSDTEMQTEPEQECTSTSEKQDLEGIETPGSPFSKNNHSSENESSQSFHSPMMQQEIEVENSVLSSDSEHQKPKGQCVLDSLEENLQDSKHDVLESSSSLKEQHSEDSTDVSVLENAELLSPTPSENVDNHSEGSLISFTLNRVEQSEVVCSTKDHDDTREKCILEPASSEDSSKTNISTELNVVVPMDTFILEQKSNLDIQINNLAGSVKETEQRECFEESATGTCILEDSEENTSPEKSVNESVEVVCSTKDHDDTREKCILEPASSEDSSKTNISTELNAVVPMDTFILEQKSNLDIQINNLAGSIKETEQTECFEESATGTCILEDSEENTSPERSVNESVEDTEFAQTDTTENFLDACENISEIIETKETSTSIESFESSLKPPAFLDECKITLADNNENGNASKINCEQPTVLGDDDYDSVAMQCDSLSDQNDSEIDHPSEVKENLKLDLEVKQKETLNLDSVVAICTTEELNSPNTEPKQINDKIKKSDSRTRKSRFHSPSTQWSRSKSEVKERQRSRSPAKPKSKSRSRSPAKPKSRSRSPAKPTSKSRSRSPAKPTSKSRSRSRERDGEREKGGQWKGRSRDHRSRKQSHSRSRTRSRSRSGNRSKIRNRCIAPERNEKVCFSPPWKERWPPDNFKGSRGNERYKRNKQDRPREYFRNDWQDINKDKFEQHYEDKNKNDYPDWVVEQKSVKHRGRGQDRPRQSYRGSHWEDNQYNSRDSWNKNANLDWHSPRGGGFRGRGGFRGAFNHGDQNESRWNNRSSFSGNSGYEQSRFPEPRNYKPKFEQDQFGSPAARSGWSSTSSWAVRKTLPADVQNYYSKNSKRGRTTGLQSAWPKQDEPSDPDHTLDDQASQHNEGSHIPLNVIQSQMNTPPPQMTAPPQINDPQITVPPPQLNAHQMTALPPQMNAPPLIGLPPQINAPQMTSPPPQMNAPPPQMNALPPQMNIPQMSAPLQINIPQMIAPPPQMNAPPPHMSALHVSTALTSQRNTQQMTIPSPQRNAPPQVSALSPSRNAPPPKIAATPPQIAAPPPQKNNQPLQLNAHSQRNAPVQSMNIFPYTVSVHPPLVNVQHNPYNVHPSVRVQLQQGVPCAKVSDSTSGPQGLPPPPPPPPPSQQVSCVASQSDGKIQKVQIQERAAHEVKMAIKPYYQNKDITKEEYKEIVKKAVDKVCHSKSGEVDSSKVANLVKAYVDKYKHSRKKGPD